MVITKKIKMELTDRQRIQAVDVMQNDACTRALAFRLFCNGRAWEIPEGVSAAVSYRKPDGTVGLYDTLPDGSPAVTLAENVATALLAPQTVTVPGKVDLSVVLQDGLGKRLATFDVALIVHMDPAAGVTESDNYVNLHTYLPQPANAAAVGQYLEIEEVSESGQVTKVKAVDAPEGGGGAGAADAVRYTKQTLTDEQKAQARENIGAQPKVPFFDLAEMGLAAIDAEGVFLETDTTAIIEALNNGAVKIGFNVAMDGDKYTTAVIHGAYIDSIGIMICQFILPYEDYWLDTYILVESSGIGAVIIPKLGAYPNPNPLYITKGLERQHYDGQETVYIEIPTQLPNPNALTFTGAVSATYDGSEAVSIEIPSGGGGSGEKMEVVANFTTAEEVSKYTFLCDGRKYKRLICHAHIIGTTSNSGAGFAMINLNNDSVYFSDDNTVWQTKTNVIEKTAAAKNIISIIELLDDRAVYSVSIDNQYAHDFGGVCTAITKETALNTITLTSQNGGSKFGIGTSLKVWGVLA